MRIHSFDRKLSALSNAVSGKVVRLIGRELFDLIARGDIFFESPCRCPTLRDAQFYRVGCGVLSITRDTRGVHILS